MEQFQREADATCSSFTIPHTQLTNSLDDIDKVLTIEPRHFGALSGQARIFIKLQKYEKAIKSIERALEFYPSFRSRELIPEIERLIKEESI